MEESFKSFLNQEKHEMLIDSMALNRELGFTIDFMDLYLYNPEFATELMNNPKKNLQIISNIAQKKLVIRNREHALKIGIPHIYVKNLPYEVKIRDINSENICHLIQINGIITRATESKPLITKAAFKCTCGEFTYIQQESQFLTYPNKCESCKSTSFELTPNKTTFIPVQWITIQERPEELPPGQIPRSFPLEVREELVNQAMPGNRVKVVGVVDVLRKSIRSPSRTMNIYMRVNSIDLGLGLTDDLELTAQDEKKIHEMAKDPWLWKKFTQSIAPSIYGRQHIKEAMALQQFRGVPVGLEGERIRGDIPILLIGDPGTGKSQLLRYQAMISPRGLFTVGRGSSAAGLTVAVVKDKDGTFVLEAGALVLADNGICCIDEIEKMREDDRGAIHPALEQQIVSVAKGGIVAELNARTAVLASANPTLGRYNPYQNIAQNISLPISLLNRFDLIFLIRDTPQKEADRKIAQHILKTHQDPKSLLPSYDIRTMKQYISYAKKITPKLTPEVSNRLEQFYLKMRDASAESGEVSPIMITARQLESLIRLTEARARLHLREETMLEDAEVAIFLLQNSLEQVGIDVATGKIDVDTFMTGKPKGLQEKLSAVLEIISDLARTNPIGAPSQMIYDTAREERKIKDSETTKLLRTLSRDGVIYQPRPNHYRRTST